MSQRQYKNLADKFEAEMLASLPQITYAAECTNETEHKEKMRAIFNTTKRSYTKRNVLKTSFIVIAAAVLAVSVCMCFGAIRDPIINTVVSAITPAQNNEDEAPEQPDNAITDAGEQPEEVQQQEEQQQAEANNTNSSKADEGAKEKTKEEQAAAAENSSSIRTGKWGDNITYKINDETGVMELSGSGKIADLNGFSADGYDEFSVPPISTYDPDKVDNYTLENLGTSEKPYGNIYLSKIIIGEGITEIGTHAFNGLSVSEVSLPSTLTKIGFGAFYRCANLKKIIIPSATTTIESYAFASCSSLSSITLSEGLKTIEEEAFSACTSLTEVTIPLSIKFVSSKAFIHCTNLKKFAVNAGNMFYSAIDGILYADGGGKVYSCPENYQKSTVIIPDGTNGIGFGAFYRCKNITKIVCPTEMKYLSSFAIYQCPSIQLIQFPNKLTKQAMALLYGCESLEKINLPYNATNISIDFKASTKLKTIVIPETVTDISGDAFNNCFNVILYCHEGSYAHSYAVEHGLKYSLLG